MQQEEDRRRKRYEYLCRYLDLGFYYENAPAAVDQGWDALMSSLDGPEKVHDEIRGRKDIFKRVTAGIRAVKRSRAAAGKSVPWLFPLINVSTASRFSRNGNGAAG